MNAIRGRKNAKKDFRPFGDRPVECHFGLCLQQKWLKGGGSGRKIDWKVNKSPKNLTTKVTKEHEGFQRRERGAEGRTSADLIVTQTVAIANHPPSSASLN